MRIIFEHFMNKLVIIQTNLDNGSGFAFNDKIFNISMNDIETTIDFIDPKTNHTIHFQCKPHFDYEPVSEQYVLDVSLAGDVHQNLLVSLVKIKKKVSIFIIFFSGW